MHEPQFQDPLGNQDGRDARRKPGLYRKPNVLPDVARIRTRCWFSTASWIAGAAAGIGAVPRRPHARPENDLVLLAEQRSIDDAAEIHCGGEEFGSLVTAFTTTVPPWRYPASGPPCTQRIAGYGLTF